MQRGARAGPGDRYQNWDSPRRQVEQAPSDYTYAEGSERHCYEEIDKDELQRNDSFGLVNQNRFSRPERPVVSSPPTKTLENALENALSSARSSESRDEYRGVQSTWDCPFSGDNFL